MTADEQSIRALVASWLTASQNGDVDTVLSLIAVGGALAASGAGGPLYPARVWIETVALPSDPGARAAAELTRLQSRMS